VRHSFRPVYLLGDPTETSPRIFVELWDTKDWPDVLAHLAKLPGVSDTAFRAATRDEPGLSFTYEGHSFSFYRAGGDYMGEVGDAVCPDDILLRVAHHLNQLLCPVTTHRL
jgi:hypothetical protein